MLSEPKLGVRWGYGNPRLLVRLMPVILISQVGVREITLFGSPMPSLADCDEFATIHIAVGRPPPDLLSGECDEGGATVIVMRGAVQRCVPGRSTRSASKRRRCLASRSVRAGMARWIGAR